MLITNLKKQIKSRNSELMKHVHQLFYLVVTYQFEFRTVHMASKSNHVADALSRLLQVPAYCPRYRHCYDNPSEATWYNVLPVTHTKHRPPIAIVWVVLLWVALHHVIVYFTFLYVQFLDHLSCVHVVGCHSSQLSSSGIFSVLYCIYTFLWTLSYGHFRSPNQIQYIMLCIVDVSRC